MICPVCGKKIRIVRYLLGGGHADCFTCRTSVRVLPYKTGYIISKHIYPAYTTNGRYGGPELTDLVITHTKLPFLSEEICDIVRQTTKDEVIA